MSRINEQQGSLLLSAKGSIKEGKAFIPIAQSVLDEGRPSIIDLQLEESPNGLFLSRKKPEFETQIIGFKFRKLRILEQAEEKRSVFDQQDEETNRTDIIFPNGVCVAVMGWSGDVQEMEVLFSLAPGGYFIVEEENDFLLVMHTGKRIITQESPIYETLEGVAVRNKELYK